MSIHLFLETLSDLNKLWQYYRQGNITTTKGKKINISRLITHPRTIYSVEDELADSHMKKNYPQISTWWKGPGISDGDMKITPFKRIFFVRLHMLPIFVRQIAT